jgi:hypothetical protein
VLIPILEAEGVDDLLGDDDVRRDVLVLNKSSLSMINIVG